MEQSNISNFIWSRMFNLSLMLNKSIPVVKDVVTDTDTKYMEFMHAFRAILETKILIDKELIKERSEGVILMEMRMEKLFHVLLTSEDTNYILPLAHMYIFITDTLLTSVSDHFKQHKLYICIDALVKCLTLLKRKEIDNSTIVLALLAFHLLDFVLVTLGKAEKSGPFLYQALHLYYEYVKKQECPIPMYHLNDQLSNQVLLENLYTNIIFDIINKNDIKFRYINTDKIVTCRYKLLKRKLISKEPLKKEDYIPWIVESGHLCEYLTTSGRLIEARSHLIAADYMLKRFYDEVYLIYSCEKTSLSEKNAINNDFVHGMNLINRYCATYGIELLQLCRKNILQNEQNDKLCKAGNLKTESQKSDEKTTELLTFDLKTYVGTFVIPINITDKYLLNYDTAKTVFVTVLKYLNEIKDYKPFNIMTLLSIKVDNLKAHKYFANYEKDNSKLLKIYKMQLNILKDIDPNFFLNTSLHKYVTINLVYCHSSLLYTKIELTTTSSSISNMTLETIKPLIMNCINACKSYLNITKLAK